MDWQIIYGAAGAYNLGQALYNIGKMFAQPDMCNTAGVCYA